MEQLTVPCEITDPVNAQILAVSEEGVEGFAVEPFAEIARLAGLPESLVTERLRAMLEAGVIRRIRQTLTTTNLAPGALVAWQVPPDCLDFAFTYLAKDDPFSGHVVIRSTDEGDTPGSKYCLWTTLKVPVGFSMVKHCNFLKEQIGAVAYKIMPAKRLFTLGAGEIRDRKIEPGSRAAEGRVVGVNLVELGDLDWRVLTSLRRDFTSDEIHADPWRKRARDAGESLDEFVRCAHSLAARGVIVRFSTSIDPFRNSNPGIRVARCNALFHWRVPEGREIDAGKEIARHHVISHTYWREAGPEFGNVNVMAVANGTGKEAVLEHKFLLDEHIREAGIPILYTNIFWGGRTEMKRSEISPVEYASWCRRVGCDPREMRATAGSE